MSDKKKTTKAVSTVKKSVEFKINAMPGSQVYLAGSFTQWSVDQKILKDRNNRGEYRAKVMLEPGVYEYKFIVNDAWMLDPDNPNFNSNGLGTLNSVVVVD